MSALDLPLQALKSPQIRSLATRTLTGVRAIGGAKTGKEGEEGNIIVKVWNFVNKLGSGVSGFLLSAIGGGLQWTFTSLMTQIQMGVRFLWNFNWQASDAELDAQYAAYTTLLAGQLGASLGNAVGWAVCGIGPGLIMMKFNKLLALRVLKEVGEEAMDELIANLRVLVQQAAQLAFRQTLITSYKSGRRILKEFLTDESGPGKKIAESLGLDGDRIKQWGEKGNQPWSFALGLENWIENIENPLLEAFTEEFIEEFFDACSEAFYVVANTADQWMMEQKLEQQGLLGNQEYVEIVPNRENEDEKIVIAGPTELIKPVIVSTMAQHQMLEERNLGIFMGETIESVANREYSNLMLRLVYSASDRKKDKPTTVTLYNVDKAKLDWTKIKTAMGGINGYMWGPYHVSAVLNDETFIKIWAQSESEGIDRVKALAELVQGEILTINSLHQLKEGKRAQYDTMYKFPRRQYPWQMVVINPVQILNEENGKSTKKGIYKDREALLHLWPDTRPDDWDTKLFDLFATPGTNGI